MRILQIGKFYPVRGGVEKVMYDIMLGLSRQKVYCDMLCATIEDQKPGIVQINPYGRLICVKTLRKVAATTIAPAMISTLCKIKNDYDIIHIHHPDPMACLALFLSGYKGKVVLHWHSDILKQKTILKFYGPLQNWLIRRADIIAGTTPVYVKESPFLADVQEKVDFIPIGINPIVAEEDGTKKIRQQYDKRKIIFSLGRLVEYKGYEYLIRAAQHLPDDFAVVIGGTGPLRDELLQLIETLGVGNRVELIGFVSDEDVPSYFTACDVFCLSSIWKTEAFAIVQIEAMSCGKPVVSTRIEGSGVGWVNTDGVSGLTVEPEDEKALAGALISILADESYCRKLAEGAKQRYEEMFTERNMVEKCLSLYNRLLARELAVH
ncbi:MAG: glycosyltransferase [Dysgonamonadaceae bacterium]|jgi:rhamnosyl/mannosyltransferase|nr:glycosyltransferase [Dysgonamonadaceae bacterium]